MKKYCEPAVCVIAFDFEDNTNTGHVDPSKPINGQGSDTITLGGFDEPIGGYNNEGF